MNDQSLQESIRKRAAATVSLEHNKSLGDELYS